ncbi:hypothetical protein Tco_0349056 [Tanacetum coccineum]
MPRKSSEDHKNTRAYIPIISHEYRTPIKEKLRNIESHYIHEGRVVFDNFADLNYVRSMFSFVEFECLLEISDQICPRFILEFYSQYQINYSDEGEMFIEFVIQNQFFSYSLEEFAQILDIPCEGACVFTDKWSLDELAYGVPTDGPYQTNPPSPDDIISSIRIDREGQVRRIRHEEEIDVLEYQVLTREIEPTLKPLEEIIRENRIQSAMSIRPLETWLGNASAEKPKVFSSPAQTNGEYTESASTSHQNGHHTDNGNGISFLFSFYGIYENRLRSDVSSKSFRKWLQGTIEFDDVKGIRMATMKEVSPTAYEVDAMKKHVESCDWKWVLEGDWEENACVSWWKDAGREKD